MLHHNVNAKLKTHTVWFAFLIIFLACNKNSIETGDDKTITEYDKKFRASPLEDAVRLFFRLSDSVRVDSIAAGKIQFFWKSHKKRSPLK